MLNIPIPIVDLLESKQNILIAGIGGGFDVFGGLPLYYTLQRLGKNVHLANYSFSNLDLAKVSSEVEKGTNFMMGANANFEAELPDYCEGYLSKWFKIGFNEDVPIWCFEKTGVHPLRQSYQYLIERFKIDLIILVDGGVDSLNTGSEQGCGTILEDSITIAALQGIEGVDKIIACIGFGTEMDDHVCHHNVLRNMSNLIKNDGFYGTCSLVKSLNSYKFYKSACTFVFTQPNHKTSHIQRRIIPAIEGEFGNFHFLEEKEDIELFISPLMSIYWFFKFDTVALFNRVLPYLAESNSFFDAVQEAVPYIKSDNNKHPIQSIPY